jgi:hypothetical protein
MMVLKIFFTDDEIRKFFESNGFKCEIKELGEWRNTYHNKSEWVPIDRLCVIFPNGKYTDACKLFEQVTEQRMKRQIAPANLEVQRLIENTYKSNLKTIEV